MSNTKTVLGILAVVVVGGGIAAVLSSGGGKKPVSDNGYALLPGCAGLVLTNEEVALERARTIGKKAMGFTAAMAQLLGCGIAVTAIPAYKPNGRFIYNAVRAAVSELVKRGKMSATDATQRLVEAAVNLGSIGVDMANLPEGLEP